MVALFQRHHEERAFTFAFNAALISMDLAAAIDDPNWLCLTADRCALVAFSYRPMFSPNKVATELMLRCERPRIRPQMIAHFENWARTRHCKQIALASTHAYEAFKRLYKRDGYAPAEMTFAKEL
ncbi:hypothetical protein X566_01560 [Afipia sp. P52-10]|nr:hypothetical protein X566_01560 [Afipia sp. P52-10]